MWQLWQALRVRFFFAYRIGAEDISRARRMGTLTRRSEGILTGICGRGSSDIIPIVASIGWSFASHRSLLGSFWQEMSGEAGAREYMSSRFRLRPRFCESGLLSSEGKRRFLSEACSASERPSFWSSSSKSSNSMRTLSRRGSGQVLRTGVEASDSQVSGSGPSSPATEFESKLKAGSIFWPSSSCRSSLTSWWQASAGEGWDEYSVSISQLFMQGLDELERTSLLF
mmetsp:Transcript_11984/g.23075  ORF Transcript_11984/g.23075 Transcript_11984/m.23075 type:complete len:227 (+) Transcript_11984:650-1330(+)